MRDDEKRECLNPDASDAQQWIPTVALRGVVAFPNMVLHFDVAREMSKNAIEEALAEDRKIFLVAQKKLGTEKPKRKDLYRIGVVAEIRQVLRNGEVMRVLVEGLYRARVLDLQMNDKPYLETQVKRMAVSRRHKADEIEMDAMMRSLRDVFQRYASFFPKMPKELIESLMAAETPFELFESIAFNVQLDYTDRQQLLEENDLFLRMTMLYAMLVREIEVLEVEREIHSQVQESLDKGQREYYLREQMRVISAELGEEESSHEEVQNYLQKIHALSLEAESEQKLVREAERLLKMPPSSQEAYVIRNYLDTVLDLPWNTKTKEKLDIKKAAALLDQEHYGLKRVKERVLESLSVHALMPSVKGQILCLVGPPGVGKTSIGRSIAKALGRNYVRVSLGGVRDESDIRGHRKTYVGAMPGRIMDAMRQAKSKNPLILLDEIDKMGNDYKGDPASAMLEVLDSEQNHAFRDHFLELPFDLSEVMFVTTANTLDTIPGPLRDRMEIIELNSYTRLEKFHIAKRHLLKKQLKLHGLKATQLRITDAALYDLIDYYTKEAGVRSLERQIASLCRKCAKAIVADDVKRIQYTPETLETALGPHKYLPDYQEQADTIGLVNGLAWTSAGGVLMPLEVLVMDGKGEIQVTGSLGDVMKESAKLAVSYTRYVAKEYDIRTDLFKTKDLHIHAPEGAVPKDGPSAGVTMLTALVSALSGTPVRHDVAMTGEITLHGRVLPIGGLCEKSMAAYKAGIKTVIIPKANVPDLEELDAVVRNAIEFIPAETVDTVLQTALVQQQYDTKLEPLHSTELQKLGLPAVPMWDQPQKPQKSMTTEK
ncbi:MAG: endopeptidase La [Oscillospiraceae bacterium]|nr:endopeptidase La [Oscillospiraceae bacterium]